MYTDAERIEGRRSDSIDQDLERVEQPHSRDNGYFESFRIAYFN